MRRFCKNEGYLLPEQCEFDDQGVDNLKCQKGGPKDGIYQFINYNNSVVEEEEEKSQPCPCKDCSEVSCGKEVKNLSFSDVAKCFLDLPVNIDGIEEEVKKLSKDGNSSININGDGTKVKNVDVTTYKLEDLEKNSDRCAVLNNGKIIIADKKKEEEEAAEQKKREEEEAAAAAAAVGAEDQADEYYDGEGGDYEDYDY